MNNILIIAFFILTHRIVPYQSRIIQIGSASYRDGVPAGFRPASSLESCFSSSARFVDAKWKLSDSLKSQAKPSHKWWSSAAWKRCLDSEEAKGSNVLWAYPLSFRARSNSLQVSYPKEATIFQSNVFSFLKSYKHLFDPFDFQIYLPEAMKDSMAIDTSSDFHVTFKWSYGKEFIKITIGRGILFIMVELSPGSSIDLIFQGRANIWYQNGQSFGISLQSFRGPSIYRNYAIFHQNSITWFRRTGVDKNGAPQTTFSYLGKSQFISIAPVQGKDQRYLEFMEKFAFTHIYGGSVQWKYESIKSLVTVSYKPQFKTRLGPYSSKILYAAPPHLVSKIRKLLNVESTIIPDFKCSRGPLRIFAVSQFQAIIHFSGIVPILPFKDVTQKSTIESMLKFLSNMPSSSYIVSSDSYWTGKALQKVSDLALIANELKLIRERNIFLSAIKTVLNNWFSAGSQPFFAYDRLSNSLIGYPSSYGSDTDLNDHHFHYGYFIKSSAVVAMFDKKWGVRYRGIIDLLIKDVANTDITDSRFPLNRQYDHYVGHHYASGHAAFISGNNQESSSEAMNFNAALILWGEATGDLKIRDLGIYMYSMESVSIQYYWFDIAENYPLDFPSPYSSLVWDDGGSYEIFWGPPSPEEIHGINLLPLCSTSIYLGSLNISQHLRIYKYMMQMKSWTPTSVWKDLIWMWRVLFAPREAISEFVSLDYTPEAGNTRVSTAYWIFNIASYGHIKSSIFSDYPFCVTMSTAYACYNMSPNPRVVKFSDGRSLQLEGLASKILIL